VVKVDVLFTAWNRVEFVKASFGQLVANTDWRQVHSLLIHDDGSEDGAREYLAEACERIPHLRHVVFHHQPLGGPVAAMNWMLDQADPEQAPVFAKIDSDFICCPGWLGEAVKTMRLNPGLDVLGIAPNMGPPEPPSVPREVTPASYVGGVGLMRHRMFEACRPVSKGRMGWTAFQDRHPHMSKGWLAPDMPCFELDRLPLEPWTSLAGEYVANGWARTWPTYPAEGHAYWDWWTQ
jgi:glycosyltransferase involved in cell wall biosynthesis